MRSLFHWGETYFTGELRAMFTAPAMWNQILRINRLSPALPVTQLLQTPNYQSAAIPPGRSVSSVLEMI